MLSLKQIEMPEARISYARSISEPCGHGGFALQIDYSLDKYGGNITMQFSVPMHTSHMYSAGRKATV